MTSSLTCNADQGQCLHKDHGCSPDRVPYFMFMTGTRNPERQRKEWGTLTERYIRLIEMNLGVVPKLICLKVSA